MALDLGLEIAYCCFTGVMCCGLFPLKLGKFFKVGFGVLMKSAAGPMSKIRQGWTPWPIYE